MALVSRNNEHPGYPPRTATASRQAVAELLRTLDAAGIRRHDGDLRIAQQRREMADKQRIRLEVLGAAADGVLKGREVVHVERDDAGLDCVWCSAPRVPIARLAAAQAALQGRRP